MQDHHMNRPMVDVVRRELLSGDVLLDMPGRRARFWTLVVVGLMLAVSVYLFLSTNQILERFQSAAVEDDDAARIRQYNEKLQSLQDRMTVFVADSVENRIKTLEDKVSRGTVGVQEIKTLEELRGEIKLLEKYSTGKGGNLTDLARLEHPRFQITPGSQNQVASGDLLYEVSQMKRLLYFGIASCGLAGLMLGGYWWQTASRQKRLASSIPPPRLLVGKPPKDR